MTVDQKIEAAKKAFQPFIDNAPSILHPKFRTFSVRDSMSNPNILISFKSGINLPLMECIIKFIQTYYAPTPEQPYLDLLPKLHDNCLVLDGTTFEKIFGEVK